MPGNGHPPGHFLLHIPFKSKHSLLFGRGDCGRSLGVRGLALVRMDEEEAEEEEEIGEELRSGQWDKRVCVTADGRGLKGGVVASRAI